MLTDKQQEILEFIRETLGSTGIAPSYRDIAGHFSVSIGTVQDHLKALERKGHLTRPELRHRGIVPVDWRGGVSIPVVGQVRAGLPMLAEENIESYINVDRNFIRGERLFALKVRGDSMKDAGIFEGDTVIIRPQETAQNGDIVVALNQSEATVKYYRLRRGEVYLEPANPDYLPLKAREFDVLGKVVGLIRRYPN
ncbi:MAG TPA: transcriptional repressor LexA [Elusimicrobiota bacterium]|nr:transcriptional repressor LexA [Elusimicrobiota bacterium]